MPKFGWIWTRASNLGDNLYKIAIILVTASILVTSAVGKGGIDSAYAQVSGFIPESEFDSEGNATQQSPVQDQQLQDQIPEAVPLLEDETLAGQAGQQQLGTEAIDQTGLQTIYDGANGMGIAYGSKEGIEDGVNDRELGLFYNSTIAYQPLADEDVCILFIDYNEDVQIVPITGCNAAQREVRNFIDGFHDGYAFGYTWGYYSGYFLDQALSSQNVTDYAYEFEYEDQQNVTDDYEFEQSETPSPEQTEDLARQQLLEEQQRIEDQTT